MFQLENKYYLYALGLIPLFIVLFMLVALWRKKALRAFGDNEVIQNLFPDVSNTKRIWKFIFYTIAFAFLIIGIVNPQAGTKLEEVKRKGADLMICLDISNSMKAEDLYPNRLEKAKQAISKLIDKLEGDRIGVIVFAGDAFVQLPITTDYAAGKLFLESINTDLIPNQGTDVGGAIDLAIESFGKDEGKNKAIVIITDGEDNEQGAVTAAETAAEKGIAIHTIGMGSVEGTPIPLFRGTVRDGFRKDKEGNTVVTKLNESILEQIAGAASGIYVRASNSDAGLNNVLDAINRLEKKEINSKMYSSYEDRFQWFISTALLLLLIETFMTERKSKLYQRLNLFGNEKK